MEDCDYTGVPVRQLREQIALHLGDKSKRWLSEVTEIDPRELDRIMDRAPDHAIIGLNKSDRILMALRQNIAVLELQGELDVVPLGAQLTNAKKMAEDIFWAQYYSAQEVEVSALARILLKRKNIILGRNLEQVATAA